MHECIVDDRDNSGVIDTAEVIQMTKDVYGKKIDTNPYTKGFVLTLTFTILLLAL